VTTGHKNGPPKDLLVRESNEEKTRSENRKKKLHHREKEGKARGGITFIRVASNEKRRIPSADIMRR